MTSKKKIFITITVMLTALTVGVLYSIVVPKNIRTTKADAITLVSPYKNYANNYKGNIHAHSTNSDGADSPTVVGEWYRDNGYDFYAITDHNYLTPDPGVSGILWLGKSEEGSLFGNTAHMGNLNINTVIPNSDAQTMISNASAQGGKTVLHHIDRVDKRWTAETIESLNNVMGLEIYNGGGLNSTGTWDTVLTSGKTVWGEAADDSHSSAARGTAYVVVNSDKVSPTNNDILTEMAAGNFYASRGFDLDISVSGDTVTASTTSGNKIRWIKHSGGVVKTTGATTDNYTLTGSEYYVRVEVLDGSDTPKAWSQPIYVSGASPPPPPPPTYTPVYRFWNINGTHFYTASESEKNNVMARWGYIYRYEGIAYYLNISLPQNNVALWRLWNNNGTHFYTANYAEAINAVNRWPTVFRLEGIAYNVSLSGGTPVYRFYNIRNGTHFYTASEVEKNCVITQWPNIYRLEGIGYYLGN